jgi:hypothetical protein
MSDEKQSYATADVVEGNRPQDVVEIPISEKTTDLKFNEDSKDLSISKADSKTPYKDATNIDSVPPYTDEEGKAENVIVSDAEDLVTRVIHVEDDPTLNPWTFRMFFLGMSKQALWLLLWLAAVHAGGGGARQERVLTKRHRAWLIHIWVGPPGDFLLQAADHLRFRSFPDRPSLYSGGVYGSHDT